MNDPYDDNFDKDAYNRGREPEKPDKPDDPQDDELYDLVEPSMPEPDPTYGQPPPIEFAQVSCTQCGYNLTGVSIGSACPECGTSVDSSLYAASGAPASGKAITSMVLGICSIVMCCCPGLILGIIGLVFGMMAMEDLKTGSFSSGSRSMAIAGLWCSGIGIALGLLYWLMQLLPLLFA